MWFLFLLSKVPVKLDAVMKIGSLSTGVGEEILYL